MVESSVGGSCRCQEEYSSDEEPAKVCCNPQVFTSVLLGILACVLMTGGVFLAFHKWDPLWLIVSGVGVILVLIGSILHCCGSEQSVRRHPDSGKGRPVQSDHPLHGHLVANNGSLAEQLLPLSNARSVSQLSLNMLPGYFPPVVTTYGIEQHSAVVQNINRIVQQQQQQQSPQGSGSTSPGVVSGAGKSFILLSLPGDSNPANIQNLVATVYQLDGNTATETQAAENNPPSSTVSAPVAATPNRNLRNAEVQTCNRWPSAAPNHIPTVGNQILTSSANSSAISPVDRPSTSTATCTAQTDPIPEAINLMDCSPEVPSVCDNGQSTSDSPAITQNVNIPLHTDSVLVDVTTSSTNTVIASPQSTLVTDTPEASTSILLDLPTPATNVLVEVGSAIATASAEVPTTPVDVLIDISDSITEPGPSTSAITPPDVAANNVSVPSTSQNNTIQESPEGTSNTVQSEVANSVNVAVNEPFLEAGNSELSLSCSNLSELDGEVDDDELLSRSSPPPSYDDVAHEGENAIGAFGLAYGTI